MSGNTQYGFDWGPVRVERTAHIKGRGYVVTVMGLANCTHGPVVQVLVSERGRAVTAYPQGGAKVKTSNQEGEPRS